MTLFDNEGELRHVSTQAQLRRLTVLQQHLSSLSETTRCVVPSPCRATTSRAESKVSNAVEAVALIPDSAVITVRLGPHGCFLAVC